MLITFEGLDGCGKTTQASRLVETLRRKEPGAAVYFIREPGGTAISEKIRDMLLNRQHEELDRAGELLLFSASRAQLVSERIGPALSKGAFVVCDRFYDSTTAYQGYGRGIDLETIAVINRFATRAIVPDISFFIDIPIGEILRRKGSEMPDRMENAGKEFYERVRGGYLAIAAAEPARFVVINGTDSVDSIGDFVWEKVRTASKMKREKNRI